MPPAQNPKSKSKALTGTISRPARASQTPLFKLGAQTFRYGDFVAVRCHQGLPFIAFICDKREQPIPLSGDVQLQWLYRSAISKPRVHDSTALYDTTKDHACVNSALLRANDFVVLNTGRRTSIWKQQNSDPKPC